MTIIPGQDMSSIDSDRSRTDASQRYARRTVIIAAVIISLGIVLLAIVLLLFLTPLGFVLLTGKLPF